MQKMEGNGCYEAPGLKTLHLLHFFHQQNNNLYYTRFLIYMKQKKCHNYFTFLQEVLDIFLCFFQISFLQKDRDDLKVTGNIMILLP